MPGMLHAVAIAALVTIVLVMIYVGREDDPLEEIQFLHGACVVLGAFLATLAIWILT